MLLPMPPDRVPLLTASRAASPPTLDGRLAADCWRAATWTEPFVDLVTGAATAYETRAALL